MCWQCVVCRPQKREEALRGAWAGEYITEKRWKQRVGRGVLFRANERDEPVGADRCRVGKLPFSEGHLPSG